MSPIPDHETHMAEVKALGEAARDSTTESTPPPARPGVVSPIHMAPADQGIPFEYVLHVHQQECQKCGCIEQWSEMFAHFGFKSRMGGSTVKHLRRTDKPLYNLPVRRIPIAPKPVPFCSDCTDIDLSHLPPPPNPAALTDAPEALMRGGKPMYGKKEEKEAKPKKPTLKSTDLSDLV